MINGYEEYAFATKKEQEIKLLCFSNGHGELIPKTKNLAHLCHTNAIYTLFPRPASLIRRQRLILPRGLNFLNHLPTVLRLLAPDASETLHHLAEAHGGVEEVEGQGGDDDHDALEADEQVLALHQLAVPAVGELGDAVDAAPEDADGGQGQGGEEAAEHLGVADAADGLVLVEGGVAEAAVAQDGVDGEVERDGHEDDEGEDLEGEAGDHDVVARVARAAVVRGHRGHAAARGLQHERDDIAGDEDAGVVFGREPAVLGPEGVDDAAEAEVDAGGHEGGRDGQAADLDEEAVLVPLVLPRHDSAGVADNLADQAERHGDEETKTAPRHRVRDDVGDEREGEEGEEGGVGREVDAVPVEAGHVDALGDAGIFATSHDPGADRRDGASYQRLMRGR